MPKTSTKSTNKQTKTNKKQSSTKKSSILYEFKNEKDKRLNGLKIKFDKTIFSPKIKTLQGQTYKNKSKFIQVGVHSTELLDKNKMEGLTNFLNNQIYEKFGNKYKIEARNAVKSGAYCMEKNRYLIEQENLNHKVREFMVDSNEKDIVEADVVKDTNTFYITYYLTNQSGNAAESLTKLDFKQGFKTNKCFYNILKEYDLIDDIDEFINENELDESGTVSYNEINKIEDILEINIEVYGDMLYKRININEKGNILKTKKYDKTILMELRNGHYIKYENKPEKMPGITRKYSDHKRFNILWKIQGDNNLYFDGEKVVNEIDLNNSYYINFTQVKYYVKDNNYLKEEYINDEVIDYLRECYKNYIKDLNEFNNILNDYNKENDFKYFDDFFEFRGMMDYIKNFLTNNDKMNKIKTFKKYEQFERIEKNEFDWLNAASKGGVYSYNYKKECKNITMYDINSAYPACLLSNNFYFPYKRGEFIKMDVKYFNNKIKNTAENINKDKLQYGIYKCKITCNIDLDNIRKIEEDGSDDDYKEQLIKCNLFRFNENNYYTHYDLIVAYKLGFKIELIDDKINALVYSNDNVNLNNNTLCLSPIQFRKVISSLYELKDKKHNKFIKQMLNQIWGTLSTHNQGKGKKNKIYINKDEDDDEFEIEQNEYIENIKDQDDCYELTKYNYDKLTLYRYYRLKPFLLSFQRYNMFKVCEHFNFKVVCYNTDSIGLEDELTKEEFNKLNKWYKKLIDCDYNDYSSLGEFKKEDKKNNKEEKDDDEDFDFDEE